jgi:hypothetical protein
MTVLQRHRSKRRGHRNSSAERNQSAPYWNRHFLSIHTFRDAICREKARTNSLADSSDIETTFPSYEAEWINFRDRISCDIHEKVISAIQSNRVGLRVPSRSWSIPSEDVVAQRTRISDSLIVTLGTPSLEEDKSKCREIG